MENSDNLEILLRRNLDTIFIVGTGTILMAVWGIAKLIALAVLSEAGIESVVGPFPDDGAPALYYRFFGFFILLDFLLRIVIGRRARAEGRGKKQGSLYIVLAGFLCLNYLMSVVGRAVNLYFERSDIEDTLIMIVIDATSMVILAELIVSAVRIRKLTRQMEEHTGSPGSTVF